MTKAALIAVLLRAGHTPSQAARRASAHRNLAYYVIEREGLRDALTEPHIDWSRANWAWCNVCIAYELSCTQDFVREMRARLGAPGAQRGVGKCRAGCRRATNECPATWPYEVDWRCCNPCVAIEAGRAEGTVTRWRGDVRAGRITAEGQFVPPAAPRVCPRCGRTRDGGVATKRARESQGGGEVMKSSHGSLSDIEARIRAYELRYEMTTDEMRRQLAAGTFRETADVCTWAILARLRDDLVTGSGVAEGEEQEP